MKSITEEMRFRQRLCEYALKHGVTKAARRYHTNRQFVYRQLEKYDGSVRSLALRSRKPQHSPNAYTEEELKRIKEKSAYEMKEFIKSLRKRMGFKIETIQVDNGPEFVNDDDKTEKDSAFEKAVKKLNMELKRTRPYSPWQNGKVERSHREDGKILYGREVFTSEKELKKKVARHEKKYNSTAKTVLDFKSPDQVVAEYFSKCNKCLDS